jgi:hypothetical protein
MESAQSNLQPLAWFGRARVTMLRITAGSLILFFCAPAMVSSQNIPGTMPTLRYDRPAGFIGGGGDGAEVWVSDNSDGLLVVYPFRSFRGDFGSDFQRSLFRDLISEPFQRNELLAAPGFGRP